MRLMVFHDSKGKILSLVGRPTDGLPAGKRTMEAGEQMTEIDVSELSSDLGIDEIMKRLHAMAESHVVEVQSTPAARLVKRS